MSEITHLNGGSDWIELEFIGKEKTPHRVMRFGIQLHLAESFLAETTLIIDDFGIDRCRTTVHNWVREADLQPVNGARREKVPINETLITVNDQRFWLLRVWIQRRRNSLILAFSGPKTVIAEMFLSDITGKHDVSDAEFLADGAP